MSRFIPAACLSLALWTLLLYSAQLALVTVDRFWGSVGGLLSIAFLR